MIKRYAVSIKSIFLSTRVIQEIAASVFEFQNDYMEERYKQIYKLTRSRTMVASGELRSKLYNRVSRSGTRYTRYVCGYAPTSNNQAYHQEFDTFDKVHHGKREHYRPDGRPKCSRRPVDLYARYGEKYESNRSARRRALATSIESALGTQVSFGVDRGSEIQYQPDLSNVALKLSAITRAVCSA